MASTTSGGYEGTAYPATGGMAVPRDGWILFAWLMILFTGIWNLFEGFFAFFQAAWFIGHPVFGALWIWALAWMALGALQVAAAGAIMSGRSWGRWFGIVMVGFAGFLHLLAIPVYPWWSVIMVALNVLILYALAAHWRSGVSQV